MPRIMKLCLYSMEFWERNQRASTYVLRALTTANMKLYLTSKQLRISFPEAIEICLTYSVGDVRLLQWLLVNEIYVYTSVAVS